MKENRLNERKRRLQCQRKKGRIAPVFISRVLSWVLRNRIVFIRSEKPNLGMNRITIPKPRASQIIWTPDPWPETGNYFIQFWAWQAGINPKKQSSKTWKLSVHNPVTLEPLSSPIYKTRGWALKQRGFESSRHCKSQGTYLFSSRKSRGMNFFPTKESRNYHFFS